MKALRWHGKADVRLDTVPAPEITDAEDIVIRVTGTTICGSDLHLYMSEIVGLQSGDVLGHEVRAGSFDGADGQFMGIIDAVGPGVKNRKVGDRVVVSFQIACGKCEYVSSSFVFPPSRSQVLQEEAQLCGRLGGLNALTEQRSATARTTRA